MGLLGCLGRSKMNWRTRGPTLGTDEQPFMIQRRDVEVPTVFTVLVQPMEGRLVINTDIVIVIGTKFVLRPCSTPCCYIFSRSTSSRHAPILASGGGRDRPRSSTFWHDVRSCLARRRGPYQFRDFAPPPLAGGFVGRRWAIGDENITFRGRRFHTLY